MRIRVTKPSKAGIAAVATAVALALTGCGGGGGGGSSVPPSGDQGSAGKQANSASLDWVAPSSRADKVTELNPVEDIAGYIVRYGLDPNDLSQEERVRCSAVTCGIDIRNLSAGTWYFTVQTVDRNDLMSAPSEMVRKTI